MVCFWTLEVYPVWALLQCRLDRAVAAAEAVAEEVPVLLEVEELAVVVVERLVVVLQSL